MAAMFAGDREAPAPLSSEVVSQNRVASLTLHAAVRADGRDTFSYNGQSIAPVIRVFPGDTLKIDYVNDLPVHSKETCAVAPCRDMTNLHFHGLEISPQAPQDDVIDMMAMPGETLHYTVQIPADHPPGLYWYHTHPHGESHRQALDGMSGAIVIEGIDRYAPELRGVREQVLVLRARSIEDDPEAAALTRRVDMSQAACGSEKEKSERLFTVNGAIRPQISIALGEQQFWRIVNASADQYADVQVDGELLKIVALDGMPLAYHDPQHPTRVADHILVPPAGRVEAIVSGPVTGKQTILRTRCVDTGSAGDPNVAMVLADVLPAEQSAQPGRTVPLDNRPPDFKVVQLDGLEKSPPDFVVTFSEDKNGFYINGKKYAVDADPMVRAKVGTYQHWRIVNATNELHPMHIHQTHFLAYQENGTRVTNPAWLDTVNVPTGGSTEVIMDFTNPVIRGMSLFHCHLLNHEDKGMMAKILFE
jgi:FtsP/CotA-like multicopper oxidase with cupredoxin domain